MIGDSMHTFGSAPASNKILTISKFMLLVWHAAINGVRAFICAVFKSTRFCRINSTILVWPSLQAIVKAFQSPLSILVLRKLSNLHNERKASGLYPAFSSMSTARAHPI